MQMILHCLPTALVAGLAGVIALELAMWLITRKGWAEGNMVVAIGSLITHRRENAFFTGAMLHAISAVGFALIYTLLMARLGFAHLPTSFYAGIGFGALHGMIVSLMLVWIVSEHHPLEEFNDAGFAIGVSHVAGHVAYGAAVGLIIGLFRP
jgi:hypothetical protein